MLRLRGRWAEAEEEAESAREDFLEYNMPGEAGQASYELGELRLRRGDLAGAENAFRRVLDAGGEPQPGLALLRLVQGKPRVGLGELDRALADEAALSIFERLGAAAAAQRVGAVAEANEIVASRDPAEAGRVGFTNPRFVALKGLSEPAEIVSVDWR